MRKGDSGLGSNAKIIPYKLLATEGDEKLYSLTGRQVSALLANTEYLSWQKRHSSLPSDLDDKDKLEAWVSNLNLKLMTPLDFCAAMIENADCFLSDEGVTNIFNDKILTAISTISEIQTLIKQVTNTGGIPMLPSELTRNLFNCADAAIISGQVIFTVDYLHDSVLDFFEIFEVGTNANERASLIVKQIPAFGQYFGDLLESIDKLQEEIVENFNAQWTETGEGNYRDTLRCELYCKMLETCEFSIDTAIEIFRLRLGASVAYALSVPALLGYFLGGTFSGTLIADFAVFSQLVFLKHLNTFGKQVGLSFLDSQLAIAAHNPDDTLTLLCEDCIDEPEPEPCEDPDKWTIGTIVSNTGLSFHVAGVYNPTTGYYRVEWGNTDCSEHCYGFEYEFDSGSLNTAEILGASCTNISLASLPQNVHWFYFASPFAFTIHITFGTEP